MFNQYLIVHCRTINRSECAAAAVMASVLTLMDEAVLADNISIPWIGTPQLTPSPERLPCNLFPERIRPGDLVLRVAFIDAIVAQFDTRLVWTLGLIPPLEPNTA